MKDDRVYLKHILRCISRIEEYAAGGPEGFFSSHLVQDATLRNLQTMAESTQHLSSRLKARHPQVEWKALSGFRNVLVHDYLGVDLEYVYQAIEEQLPSLKAAAQTLIRELADSK